MDRINDSLPALALIAALIGAWWLAVYLTHSLVFPSPADVVMGTWELVRNGTL